MLVNFGLGLIVLGWAVQLGFVLRKNMSLQPAFVGFYGLGVLLLVIDGFGAGLNLPAILNLLSFVASFAILVLFLRQGK